MLSSELFKHRVLHKWARMEELKVIYDGKISKPIYHLKIYTVYSYSHFKGKNV